MPPRWRDVQDFCRRQGYAERKTDHYRYRKRLPDGSTSGTMVSFGAENEVIAANLWERVWREQLRLTSEGEFWTGLQGTDESYAIPSSTDPLQPLPAYLQRFLRDVLHWPEARIAYAPREHAQDILNEYFASDGSKADQDGDED